MPALYCRVACKETGNGESTGIKEQKGMLSLCALEKGIDRICYFTDDGYLGMNFNRKDFKEILKVAENGELNKIIVTDMSRLGRNILEVLEYTIDIFPQMGVEATCLANT